MARRLTDTYFVKYTMEISGVRKNNVEIKKEIDGEGIFVISEYDVYVTEAIKKSLNLQLRSEYCHYDYSPFVSNLIIKDIRPL